MCFERVWIVEEEREKKNRKELSTARKVLMSFQGEKARENFIFFAFGNFFFIRKKNFDVFLRGGEGKMCVCCCSCCVWCKDDLN